MASFLSSFGVTSATPPSSAYADQQAETSNLADAKADLAGVTSNIGLALTASKLLGIDSSYTKSIEDLNTEAGSLGDANLSSAQLAAKSTELQNKLAAAKNTQAAAVQKEAIDGLTTASTTVQTQLSSAEASKAPADILTEYTKLKTDLTDALTKVKAMPRLDLSGGIPTYPSPDEFLSRLETIDGKLETALNKEFNWKRFSMLVGRWIAFCTAITACIFGAYLGGTILSNAYASDPFWGIRFFYFVYGIVFFPLVVIYGTVKTPYWVSTLCPIYSTDGMPTQTAPVPDDTVDINSIPVTMEGGGGGSFTDRLFGYTLVDPDTPTEEETSNKTTLRIMAIVDAVLLGGSALFYGVDKLLKKV